MLPAPLAYIDPTGGLPPSSWDTILAAILAGLGAGLASLRLFGQQLFTWIGGHWRGRCLRQNHFPRGACRNGVRRRDVEIPRREQSP